MKTKSKLRPSWKNKETQKLMKKCILRFLLADNIKSYMVKEYHVYSSKTKVDVNLWYKIFLNYPIEIFAQPLELGVCVPRRSVPNRSSDRSDL